jgi:hypothetical protein
MKFINNFFLLALLFALFMLPMTVIDMATFDPNNASSVLSTQDTSAVPEPTLPVDNSDFPGNYDPSIDADATMESSPAVDLNQYDYYQMPSLYLGAPEGVE